MEYCQQHGISLGVVEGKLKVYAPKSAITQELLAMVRSKKSELLQIFSHSDAFTRSDFPDARITEQELATLKKRYPRFSNLYPATPMQVQIIKHGLAATPAARVSAQCYFEVHEKFAPEDLLKAWQAVVNRHDMLRTRFVELGSGEVHQLVFDNLDVRQEYLTQGHRWYLDWRTLSQQEQGIAWESVKAACHNVGFDYAHAPLLQITFVRVADNRGYVAVNYPIVQCDPWCIVILIEELLQHYQAVRHHHSLTLAAPIPYQQHIAWLTQQDNQAAQAFWRESLSGVAATACFSANEQNSLSQAPKNSRRHLSFTLTEQVTHQLQHLAHEHCTDMRTIVQAAWALLLKTHSASDDVLFGAMFPCKSVLAEGQAAMLGQFINLLIVRVNFHGMKTLKALLDGVHEDNVKRQEYSCLPYFEVERHAGLASDNRLFDSVLIYEGEKDFAKEERLQKRGVNEIGSEYGLHFPVVIAAKTVGAKLSVEIDVNLSCIDELRLNSLLSQYKRLLYVLSRSGQHNSIQDLMDY